MTTTTIEDIRAKYAAQIRRAIRKAGKPIAWTDALAIVAKEFGFHRSEQVSLLVTICSEHNLEKTWDDYGDTYLS